MSADASEGIQLVRALGHPLRQSILKEMQGGEEVSPRDLSRSLKVPLSKVAHHVRVLAECGAIKLVRTQPVRGSMQHFYRFAIKAQWPFEALGLSPPAN